MEDKRFDNWLKVSQENPRFKGDSWLYFKDYLDGKAVSTRAGYIRYFADFLEFLDTDTEQLYTEYKEMVANPDPRTKKKMAMQVNKFQKSLINLKRCVKVI